MRILNGSELAGFIKERQAKQVRALRQADHVIPKLLIIQTSDNPVIDTYIRLKKQYGEDILIEVEHWIGNENEAMERIELANSDESIHGIIVQLPLNDVARTDELVNVVVPEKDVDALGQNPVWDPATPMAINWLLAGYNVNLTNKKIVIVGQGRLVGKPLAAMWRGSGLSVETADENTKDLMTAVQSADIIVTAAGVPGLITSEMVRPDSVVVDAGTASEGGKIVGDVAENVRERHDLTITPIKGGVGPLTIAALFDNVIRSARRSLTA